MTTTFVSFLISACDKAVQLSQLPPDSSCHLSDSCTDIQCCVDVPTLQRSVSFQISLKPCDCRMIVRIEQMEYHVMLYNYSWGTEDSFWLRGLFRLRSVKYTAVYCDSISMIFLDYCFQISIVFLKQSILFCIHIYYPRWLP